MKHKLLLSLLILFLGIGVKAQTVTYEHNDEVMNQMLYVMTGAGTLKPSFYFQTFHKKIVRNPMYRVGLTERRIAVNMLLSKETKKAAAVDSAMSKEFKKEEKTMADRSTYTDLAWQIEKDKIEHIFTTFQRNISKITLYGGDRATYKLWLATYNMLQSAVNETRRSYQDSGSKQTQYVKIYGELVKNNNSVVSLLRKLQGYRHLKAFNEKSTLPVYRTLKTASYDARQRWGLALSAAKENMTGGSRY